MGTDYEVDEARAGDHAMASPRTKALQVEEVLVGLRDTLSEGINRLRWLIDFGYYDSPIDPMDVGRSQRANVNCLEGDYVFTGCRNSSDVFVHVGEVFHYSKTGKLSSSSPSPSPSPCSSGKKIFFLILSIKRFFRDITKDTLFSWTLFSCNTFVRGHCLGPTAGIQIMDNPDPS